MLDPTANKIQIPAVTESWIKILIKDGLQVNSIRIRNHEHQ